MVFGMVKKGSFGWLLVKKRQWWLRVVRRGSQ